MCWSQRMGSRNRYPSQAPDGALGNFGQMNQRQGQRNPTMGGMNFLQDPKLGWRVNCHGIECNISLIIGTIPTDDVWRRYELQDCPTPGDRAGETTLNCFENTPSPGKFLEFLLSLGTTKSWAKFKMSTEMLLGGPVY